MTNRTNVLIIINNNIERRTTTMIYSLYEEETNPGVGFNENEFILKMPYLNIVGDDEAELEKVEINFLRKQEILDNFIELFEFIEEDLRETGELSEYYETEDDEKYVTYSIFPIPEDNKIELAISFAVNIGVFDWHMYTADYLVNESRGEVYDELIEGSHVFFHKELMQIAEKNKGILQK